MPSLTRRFILKCATLASALSGCLRSAVTTRARPAPAVPSWENTPDRVWLGEAFWANPMEDWHVADGAAENHGRGGNRNIHLLTHQLTEKGGAFEMSVDVERVEAGARDGGAGFRIGVRSDIGEHRANCFAKGGIDAGLVGTELVLGDTRETLPTSETPARVTLRLGARPDGDAVMLQLDARDMDGKVLGQATARVARDAIAGNVALVSNFDPDIKRGEGALHRFRAWTATGEAFAVAPEQRLGPILWTMYSLSDSRGDAGRILKLTALLGPMGETGEQEVELALKRGRAWETVARAKLDPDAWTATFRVEHWDARAEVPYRVAYREKHRDGTATPHHFAGTVKAEPLDRPLRLGALTCQKDYAFPYQPVVDNLARLNPDLLYFSGDQLYEDHGGFGLVRAPAAPAILCYLRKFYMFGWAFRDVMAHRPTLCIPDDHDVFQGNLWGEAGAAMKGDDTSSNGGYIEPVRMVNVVHKTCASHHPDPHDPTPCQRGMSVYFGEMVYGGVGFAIIADRQWKSGPEHVETGAGRADHVEDADFDTEALDKPGLSLLGSRQEAFLERWARDFRGHDMKVLLSQTLFANAATHHGSFDGYLKADLDSGGWPQTARNRTLRLLAPAKALHVNGDQHLATLVQYGIERHRDAGWSFCTPAIAVGYPRWWRADDLGMEHADRPRHGLPDTGAYRDGFGNLVYMYAVGNPEVPTSKHRYEHAHQKGSGFGLVTIDRRARTYELEAFRFLCDATGNDPERYFPGWPVTIHQDENAGKNRIG